MKKTVKVVLDVQESDMDSDSDYLLYTVRARRVEAWGSMLRAYYADIRYRRDAPRDHVEFDREAAEREALNNLLSAERPW